MKSRRVKYYFIVIGSLFLVFGLGYFVGNEKPDSELQISKNLQEDNLKLADISTEKDDTPIIALSKNAQKIAQVALSLVERHSVVIDTPMYGEIDYDETRLRRVAAWMPGRIDRLYIDYLGIHVENGQEMAKIYSPELITAQSELIESRNVLKRLDKSDLKLIKESSYETSYASWEKLRLLGITDQQIEKIIHQGIPSEHLMLYAPLGGTVIKLDVREGVYVNTGDPLYSIADLSNLWMICEAYESDLIWLAEGGEIEFQVESYPGETFRGIISYIEPFVKEKTRTIRVRLNVPNLDYRLKPGMFVNAIQRKIVQKYDNQQPLVIPSSAPLITGKRAVVYVAIPDKEGSYEGRVITLGPKAGNYYIVIDGLSEGEQVVTRGNFLIDSAMQIMAKPSMMHPIGIGDDIEVNLPIVHLIPSIPKTTQK